MSNRRLQEEQLQSSWNSKRFEGVKRPYTAEDVIRLRGSVQIEHTLAARGAKKLWELVNTEDFVPALGALTGNQAVQQAKAGLKAIYLSGWQVAADANLSGHMYPDQSLYPANSVPHVVKRINQALQRADQIQYSEGKEDIDFFLPIVADAEAGFGGPLNVFELMKAMIEAGAAAVHFEDQLSSEKKCGHLGGKVLLPTQQAVKNLIAARLAADVLGVETVLIARTDANAARLITSDIDEYDRPFFTGERSPEGFYYVKEGLDQAIARGLAYAPYADMIWCETSEPNLDEARRFAEAIHAKFPGKLLAYNCSPSFNWKKKLDDKTTAEFQRELGKLGYKFQFVTLAGFHALNHSMFELAYDYKDRGMAAYSEFQQREFASESKGYEATRHQREVGTGYFDEVSQVISGGTSSTTALTGSTEEEQFAH
ncbi:MULTISPECIES: isocitrate lyase [Paenibacillus]|uniref:Isocitrate lyase n=1 Tax=Paenibacillus naphthalenovorans TaxID=162209 RepID=A0A0U2W730_9BACL|nr:MULTISPECIES: isocitrate lyase [Paenibacillus]ALS21210.1 isocitrate lyase [Paenibacillus naphthalenovorans]GCL72469.1 isocitrate lyase [Paenibacillus naphthalenovorans]SDH99966.1 isocitrate lyase [Paenibacillus naphthalenovorans]